MSYLLNNACIFHACNLSADVDMSFATLVEPSGRTRKQHVPVKSGMSVTLYMIIGKDDD